MKVLRGEIPDRVPVMPGYGPWHASRVYGFDLFDLEEGKASHGKLMADVTRKYNCEVWYWAGYGDGLAEVWNNAEARYETEKEVVDDDTYRTHIKMITPRGTLTNTWRYHRINPCTPVDGYIKDPARDWPIYKYALGTEWKWGDRTCLLDIPKEDLDLGITAFGLCLPVDFWKDLRWDTSTAVLEFLDGNAVMEEAMEWHRERSMQALRARMVVDPPPDMIHLQGSSSSLSVISPGIYRRYNLAFVQEACAIAHEKNVPVQIHHCGKSDKLVEILGEETEIDVIHPLESPPGGNIDLAQVKKRFGKRITLMGNLNTYQLMLFGTPAQVKEAARQCIEDAAEGGRFILANGDQLGRDTPEENVMAMVEAAHEYGKY
jgi:hypothetical protein